MGVKLSKVPGGVKAQANTVGKKLYKLVDLKGGGDLVEAMKNMKDVNELDKKIVKDVTPFLYNGGEGKKIHIKELIKMRNEERGGKKPMYTKESQSRKSTNGDKTGEGQNNEHLYRHICWDINERGSVGETILHLCLLNATSTHADLAKRLVRLFPNLINDIYHSEEYYGENVLHMAIVNEDAAMVKFLLDKGVDYHQRCCGNFFCPEDQKDSRTDYWDHESVDVCLKTNYEGQVMKTKSSLPVATKQCLIRELYQGAGYKPDGQMDMKYTYWGEYPLAFAASVEQEECVRILCAKGANPNFQDNNGNTVMHIMVIQSKLKMFLLLFSLGARLDIKNRQGLSPLSLAAKLARKEMHDHIINLERQQYWEYGEVTCAGYPLKEIDTISETGEINTNSTLSLIVYGDKEEHLFMIDGIIFSLLEEKWRTFARYRFYRRFFFFTLYFVIFAAAFALRPGADPRLGGNVTEAIEDDCKKKIYIENEPINECYLLYPYTHYDYIRLPLEVLSVIGAGIYLFVASKEIYHQGVKLFLVTLRGAPAKAMFLMSCVLVLMMIPGRITCQYKYEDIMGVMAILCTAPYFLFFCRGFRIVGPFVVMVYSMIKGDLLRFFVIYSFFVIGFSQAMYILFNGLCKYLFSDPTESVAGLFIVSLGTFAEFYNDLSLTKHSTIGKAIFITYLVLVSILLMNMLIAMMGNTYQIVASQQMEWFRQWANIVLIVEQSVTTQERIEQQKQYTQALPDGRRVLSIRCHKNKLTLVNSNDDEDD